MIDSAQLDRLIQIAYGKIGVLITAEGLLHEADDIKISVDKADPTVYHWFVASKRTPYGRKVIYSATDGLRQSKIEMRKHMVEIAADPSLNFYTEVSGPFRRMLERFCIPKIPASEVSTILGKPVRIMGDYEYERSIQGIAHRKVMFGYPSTSAQ